MGRSQRPGPTLTDWAGARAEVCATELATEHAAVSTAAAAPRPAAGGPARRARGSRDCSLRPVLCWTARHPPSAAVALAQIGARPGRPGPAPRSGRPARPAREPPPRRSSRSRTCSATCCARTSSRSGWRRTALDTLVVDASAHLERAVQRAVRADPPGRGVLRHRPRRRRSPTQRPDPVRRRDLPGQPGSRSRAELAARRRWRPPERPGWIRSSSTRGSARSTRPASRWSPRRWRTCPRATGWSAIITHVAALADRIPIRYPVTPGQPVVPSASGRRCEFPDRTGSCSGRQPDAVPRRQLGSVVRHQRRVRRLGPSDATVDAAVELPGGLVAIGRRRPVPDAGGGAVRRRGAADRGPGLDRRPGHRRQGNRHRRCARRTPPGCCAAAERGSHLLTSQVRRRLVTFVTKAVDIRTSAGTFEADLHARRIRPRRRW